MVDTTTSNPGANRVEKMKSYLRTQKGLILAGEIVISLIITICYAASAFRGYTASAIIQMVFAMIFFFIFMMELDKEFHTVNWVWSDFFRAIIGTIIYVITSLICVTTGYGDGALIAGGVFGLLAGLLFAYDSYNIFLQIRSSRQHTAASTDDRV